MTIESCQKNCYFFKASYSIELISYFYLQGVPTKQGFIYAHTGCPNKHGNSDDIKFLLLVSVRSILLRIGTPCFAKIKNTGYNLRRCDSLFKFKGTVSIISGVFCLIDYEYLSIFKIVYF